MSDLKQEYLDSKYAMYDDESDTPYRHKKIHRIPKKSKHKHEYENIIVVDPKYKNSFYLVSACKLCGKIGSAQKDKRIERKFPNVRYSGFVGYDTRHKEEYEEFLDWCYDNYEVIDMPLDSFWDLKYI